MLLLTLAAMIPPPPGWTPPTASGPGTFCGHTFRLELTPAERIAVMWAGEIFINDVYGTYYVTTAGGDVVLTEDGARTRPSGRSRDFTAGRTRFRSYGERRYSVAVAGNPSIRAVTVRFPEGTSDRAARAFLGRVRLGAPAGAQCLRPDNI
jgi:hypothetical protein